MNVAFRLRRADTSLSPLKVSVFQQGTRIAIVTIPALGEADTWLTAGLSAQNDGRGTLELQVIPTPGQPPASVWVTSVRFQLAPR